MVSNGKTLACASQPQKSNTKERHLSSLIRLTALFLTGFLLCGCAVQSIEFLEDGDFGETIMIQIEMENGGIIKIALDRAAAPLTVANFEKLVKSGFYDGLCFHRVIRGFMIQGGCPLGNGMGGADENIKGEFAQNGVQNPLRHTRGVISMARAYDPNSASSQFFIMHEDAPHLDGAYAAFGKVIDGMDTVDAIAATRTGRNDRPIEEQKIASITVDTHGETYPAPNKLPDPYGRF